ncbi:found in Wnt-1 [Halocaridina rubra]|uniref:Protein Wnt n=1 Tax=Halocaridina rubra TaxID=373956 RepID=A0AAN9A2U8_HALRR
MKDCTAHNHIRHQHFMHFLKALRDRSGSKEDGAVLDFLSAGAQAGVRECRRQFMWNRWHCPLLAFTEMLDGIPLTREQAFAHAITSASIVYSITKNCTSGLLKECSCGQLNGKVEDDFKWQGCSDDVEFPSFVAREFFESKIDGQVPHADVILHNHQAGRIAVRESLERICKCHGSSGSCTTKTCWMQLKGLSTIGRRLKKAYRRAIHLGEINTGFSFMNAATAFSRESKRTRNRNPKRRRNDSLSVLPLEELTATLPGISPHQLVFLDHSPDYCVYNFTAVSEGTGGRVCSENEAGAVLTKKQKRACRVLCKDCGYAVMQNNITVEESCNCQFVWCCQVLCEKCKKTMSTYLCHQQVPVPHRR